MDKIRKMLDKIKVPFLYIKSLIEDLLDKKSPKRISAFISLVACFVLSLSILLLVIGRIWWVQNSLASELGILVTGLTGLSVVNYHTGKKYPRIEDRNDTGMDT